ncbi:MAG: MBL fold metallo-hydrolase [Candidatus Aenigmatarchaeota archaeon]|nr:MAG: MBL fold metallo-hydrolase [Candidatus Aenigmarchaeota archaeon]
MMKLQCLGAAQEVGRSGFVLDTGSERILMDYGIKVVTGAEGVDQPAFPMAASVKLDGVVVSHAHLDHGGFVPSLYNRGYRGPVHASATTLDLMDLLLKDSLKLAKIKGHGIGYFSKDVSTMYANAFRVAYGQQFEIGNSQVMFYDAGHIPGSGQAVIDTGKGVVVYTGDMKVEKTELLNGLSPVREDVKTLIIESTYGTKEHPNRDETEKHLIKRIREAVNNDGVALVSSFAVGRAQELLLVLEKYGIDVPIYVDGMCRDATAIALRYSEFLRYPQMLQRVFARAKKVTNNQAREKILKKKHPCVIITTSGMLNGGPVAHYLEHLKDDRNSYLAMTGFQAEGSAGKALLETGVYKTEKKEFKLKVPFEKLDFSAHAGRSELVNYIKTLNPERVVCIHGEDTKKFAAALKEEHGFDAVAPAVGDTIDV